MSPGFLLSLAGAIVALYLAGGLLLFLKQRDFIYPVHLLGTATRPPPQPFQRVAITTPDGETLRAWHAPARDNRPTILHLHGNAETLEATAPRLIAVQSRGYGVLGLQFRGYPGSTGRPGEDGLTTDAAAAFDWLVARGVPERAIVVHGRSLGSGAAVKLAAAKPVGAVILEAGYTSILAIARKQFPIYPAGLLLRDPWLSIDRIGAVRQPLLIAHGRSDGLIPSAMAEEMFAAAGSPVKKLALVDGGGHDDLDAFGLVDMIDRFLRESLPP